MKKQLTRWAITIAAVTPALLADGLKSDFRTPPDSARPGVYWYFLDGNQDRDEMVAELRGMKEVGIGSVVFLEVDLGTPRGPVPFMSEPWQDNVANAFVEAGKLGMEVILGTGPGWSGSGGSWVEIDDSMQHLVGSSVKFKGRGLHLERGIVFEDTRHPQESDRLGSGHGHQRLHVPYLSASSPGF